MIIAHYLTKPSDVKTACGLISARYISISGITKHVGCKTCKRSLIYRKAVEEGK